MPSAPILNTSTSTISYLSITFISLGVIFLLATLTNIKDFMINKNNTMKMNKEESSKIDENNISVEVKRREIEDFDFNIFK